MEVLLRLAGMCKMTTCHTRKQASKQASEQVAAAVTTMMMMMMMMMMRRRMKLNMLLMY